MTILNFIGIHVPDSNLFLYHIVIRVSIVYTLKINHFSARARDNCCKNCCEWNRKQCAWNNVKYGLDVGLYNKGLLLVILCLALLMFGSCFALFCNTYKTFLTLFQVQKESCFATYNNK